jgi:hypothetical protein
MKVLWTLLKIVIGLVVVIPVSILALAIALGILGGLIGIAVLALKLVAFGLVGWVAFRLISRLMRAPASDKRPSTIADLPPVDPHYEAAIRELDRELGPVSR